MDGDVLMGWGRYGKRRIESVDHEYYGWKVILENDRQYSRGHNEPKEKLSKSVTVTHWKESLDAAEFAMETA